MTHQHRFPKSLRLRRQSEFDAVYQGNTYVADHQLVLHGRANGKNLTRLGLSVGRKVGGAVVRNQWKRLIREAFRTEQHRLPPGMDITVRPRKGATCDYNDIKKSLRHLTRRLKKKLDTNSGAE